MEILVIIYVDTFKTNVVVFIGNVIICVTSFLPIIFHYYTSLICIAKYAFPIGPFGSRDL